MKKVILLQLLLLLIVLSNAQNTDLHYGKSTNKQAKTSDESSEINPIEKPYIINIGDARSIIGVSFIKPVNKNLLFTPGVHFGFTTYDHYIYNYSNSNNLYSKNLDPISVPMINLSFLFRTNNKNFNFKWGPYINIPLTKKTNFDETDLFDEFYVGPGIALGFDYMFKSGFALGLTQNMDLFFLNELIDLDYNIFWLLPSPSFSYRFGTKNTKSNFQPVPVQNINIPYSSPTPTTDKKTDYSKFSVEELKKMLEQATKDEKYNEASNIQTEINKRIDDNKFANFTNEELKTKLEKALKAEDYEQAGLLQKEIDKRVLLKKDNKKNPNDKQPAKKTLKELENDLKKAMDAEDYKKADEIQKEINKIKK
ncbi:MAG: hypothetical protein ACOYMA_12160 [Bacteroidia bacterium]